VRPICLQNHGCFDIPSRSDDLFQFVVECLQWRGSARQRQGVLGIDLGICSPPREAGTRSWRAVMLINRWMSHSLQPCIVRNRWKRALVRLHLHEQWASSIQVDFADHLVSSRRMPLTCFSDPSSRSCHRFVTRGTRLYRVEKTRSTFSAFIMADTWDALSSREVWKVRVHLAISA